MAVNAATRSLELAVLGPGGVGGLLAGLLARGGDSVTVLASEATSEAVADHGLHIESERFGNFTTAVQAATELGHLVDACLVTVKATQLRESLRRLPAEALGRGLVIPFLNGIDHVELLREVYPPDSVVAATIRIETTKLGPGSIRHTSPFALVEIAHRPENREEVELIAAHMSATGLDVRIRDDEPAMLWDKFAMLAPLALLTTHERGNVGAVRTRRRADATALYGEYAEVARAEGVPVDPEIMVRLLDSMPESMETSMQRDQAAGRPLELDALGGGLLRRAARAGIATPLTSRLVAELEARTAIPHP